MILEGLITTLDADDSPHVAPMGPRVDGTDFTSFVLRPFPTSHTYQNLLRHPAGVLHVTDDALLLARAAIGRVEVFPPHRPATRIRGIVLANCVRWYEFRVAEVDDSTERVTITAEVVGRGDGRPWFGFNRARHAVLEAAILASRVHLLPREQLQSEFAVLQTIVNKTGGPDELEAMRLLTEFVTS